MVFAASYTGRLAPSPTGLLHLGHARTFWIAQQRARAAQGKLYLRDEDLDPQRSRPEFAAAMREDLLWLGLTWNEELRQSDRLPLYRLAMEQLLAAGLAYPCTCSRRDLARSSQAPHEDPADAAGDEEPLYNNYCRPPDSPSLSSRLPECSEDSAARSASHRSLTARQIGRSRGLQPPETSPPNEGASAPGLSFATTGVLPKTNYRFRTPDRETVTFIDVHAGSQSFTTGIDFGDFLIWRKALSNAPNDIGLPSYQLACVVDDALTRITEVVRGRDLLKSTARQILLQRALNFPTPAYFHTDLMRDAAGVRLAKRHDALALRTLRASGLTPADILALF